MCSCIDIMRFVCQINVALQCCELISILEENQRLINGVCVCVCVREREREILGLCKYDVYSSSAKVLLADSCSRNKHAMAVVKVYLN